MPLSRPCAVRVLLDDGSEHDASPRCLMLIGRGILVHLLLQLHSGLQVGVCLLRVLREVDDLAVIIRCRALQQLRQILRRRVLSLGRGEIGYQRTVRMLVQIMLLVHSCSRVAPYQARTVGSLPVTDPDRRVTRRYVMQRRGHLVTILAEVMRVVSGVSSAGGRIHDHRVLRERGALEHAIVVQMSLEPLSLVAVGGRVEVGRVCSHRCATAVLLGKCE